jgi:cytochrome b561
VPHPGIVQALFGVAIWLYVVARFYRRLRRSPPMLPSDLYTFSRRLARVVYAWLYALMFVRLAIGIWCAAPNRPIPRSFVDFQGYLAAGVLAIVTIHVLSAACRRFVMHAADTPAQTRFSQTGDSGSATPQVRSASAARPLWRFLSSARKRRGHGHSPAAG